MARAARRKIRSCGEALLRDAPGGRKGSIHFFRVDRDCQTGRTSDRLPDVCGCGLFVLPPAAAHHDAVKPRPAHWSASRRYGGAPWRYGGRTTMQSSLVRRHWSAPRRYGGAPRRYGGAPWRYGGRASMQSSLVRRIGAHLALWRARHDAVKPRLGALEHASTLWADHIIFWRAADENARGVRGKNGNFIF